MEAKGSLRRINNVKYNYVRSRRLDWGKVHCICNLVGNSLNSVKLSDTVFANQYFEGNDLEERDKKELTGNIKSFRSLLSLPSERYESV